MTHHEIALVHPDSESCEHSGNETSVEPNDDNKTVVIPNIVCTSCGAQYGLHSDTPRKFGWGTTPPSGGTWGTNPPTQPTGW